MDNKLGIQLLLQNNYGMSSIWYKKASDCISFKNVIKNKLRARA